MLLHEAIAGAEAGKKYTSASLPNGTVIKVDSEGELRVVFEQTNDSYVFTPKAQHHVDDWREVGGWASYG